MIVCRHVVVGACFPVCLQTKSVGIETKTGLEFGLFLSPTKVKPGHQTRRLLMLMFTRFGKASGVWYMNPHDSIGQIGIHERRTFWDFCFLSTETVSEFTSNTFSMLSTNLCELLAKFYRSKTGGSD